MKNNKMFIISEYLKDEKAREFFEKIKSKMIEIASEKREGSITKEYIEFEKAWEYLKKIDVNYWGVFGEKIIGDGMRSNEIVIDKGVKIEESYLTTSRDENPFIQKYEKRKREVEQLDQEITELEKELKKMEDNILLSLFSKNHNEKIKNTKDKIREKKELRESKVPPKSEDNFYKLLMTMSDEEKVTLLENLKTIRQNREAYEESYDNQWYYNSNRYSNKHMYMDNGTKEKFEEVFNEALMKVLEDENIDIQEITGRIGQTTVSTTDKESPGKEEDTFLSNIVRAFIIETYNKQQENNEKVDKETLRKQLTEKIKRKLEEIKALQEEVKVLTEELENNADEKNMEEQKED